MKKALFLGLAILVCGVAAIIADTTFSWSGGGQSGTLTYTGLGLSSPVISGTITDTATYTLETDHIYVGNDTSNRTAMGITGDVTITQDGTNVTTVIAAGAVEPSMLAATVTNALAGMEPGYLMVGNASTAAVAVAVSGDITMANDGTVAIATGVILNADINASAAIAHTKLAAVAPTYLLVGNASSNAVAVAMSGDATIDNAGAVSLGTGALVTNVVVDASYTNTVILRTLDSGAFIIESWTQEAL